jgi:hypothetical protein
MSLRLLTRSTAVAVLVAGCDLFTGPASRVDLTVAASRDTLVRETDTLVIHVRAANPTADTLRFDGSGCLLQFKIYDAAGELVAPAQLACPASLEHVRLAPGDSLTADFRWYGERWTNAFPRGAPPPELLPPGRYRIYGILDAIDDQQRSDPRTVALIVADAAM